MSKKLFISHSTKDDAHVDRIADALEAAGLTVWVDHRHGIEPGDASWDEAIRKAIVAADAGIFLMSERSLASRICGSECLLVLELARPLYVMRLEACKPENIWLYIKQIQYADLVNDFNKGIANLIRVIGGDKNDGLPQAVWVAFTGLDLMRLHLPYLNNPLRGRADDITQIQSNLGGHVLQIVGPGGLGKSRLVAEIATNHPSGAVWHRCSPVSESVDLVGLLREHLRLPADADLSNVLADLADKEPLIVVDNAENVPDGGDKHRAYADLLQQITGRGVPVILTTRAVWTDLKPRREYALAAVSLDIATQIALDFAAAEDVELSESEARDLAEKARLHPRLIEFAVGQLHERNIESVLRHLSELKHSDIKDALDEMITKTVAQMAEQAKNGADAETLLRRITILQATFPLDAIKALAPAEMKDDADQLEDALVTLQRWQFVRRDPATERYSLGDLVREALGQPNDDVFWIYVVYYGNRGGEIFSLPPEQWKDHDHDLPNILAVGDALAERMPKSIPPIEEQSDADKALFSAVSSFVWNTNRFVIERMEYRRLAWLEMGLAAAQASHDTEGEAIFLGHLGVMWNALGENQQALEYYKKVLPLQRTAGDRRGEATMLNNIGGVWLVLRDQREALTYFKQALPLYRAVEDRGGEATMLNNIGSVYYALGKKQEALVQYQQALPLYRAVGDRGGEATTLNNIGLVWDALGKQRKALRYYRRALPLYRAVGDRGGEATALNSIGFVWSELGDKQRALAYYEKGLPLRRAVGDRGGEATTLNNIGLVWSELRDMPTALGYFQQALTLRCAVGDRSGEAVTCFNIGMVYDTLGDLDQAVTYVARCVELDEQVEHPSAENDRRTLEWLIRKRDEARGS